MEGASNIESTGTKPLPLPNGALTGDDSFGELLVDLIDNTNASLHKADQAVEKFISGELDNPHDMLIQLEEANLTLQFTLQLRNKIVEAYTDITRMQL